MPASIYDFAVVQAICQELAEGKPLEQICREHPEYPTSRTIRTWALEKQEVSSAIARAREIGEEAIAAECLAIADDARNDYMEREAAAGTVTVLNAEHIQRSKLRIETRLKLLAKWNPKKWGDRLNVEANMTRRDAKDMTDDELSHIAAGSRARASGTSGSLPEPGELH